MSAAAPTGRDAAYHAVLAALRGESFVDEILGAYRADDRLSARDRGLAFEIARGTVRQIVTLRHVLQRIARFEEARVSLPLQTILLLGAYQLIWLDRVPAFAVVDSAVAQTRRFVRGRAPGMVNAMLRNVERAIADRRTEWRRLDPHQVRVDWNRACAFSQPVLPDAADDLITHLAAATGERIEMFRALVDRAGEQPAEQIAYARRALPVTILRRNTLRISRADFAASLQKSFGERAEIVEDAAFLQAGANPIHTPMFAKGEAYIQDATAYEAARLLGARPGERVLDLCAAPGGKSIALAIAIEDRGEIVACDISTARVAQIEENKTRLGLTCIRPRVLPYPNPDIDAKRHSADSESDSDEAMRGAFDAAIVDVPCSNTGAIARRPEARLSFEKRKLASLVELQQGLIQRAARCVRPGGRMVYSTCSLEPEESEQIVEGFLREHPQWKLVESQARRPNWGSRLSEWRDGGYAALLRLCADA